MQQKLLIQKVFLQMKQLNTKINIKTFLPHQTDH